MKEYGIVTLTNACTQPHTMMIESHYAVVTVMTVRGAQWPEDIA